MTRTNALNRHHFPQDEVLKVSSRDATRHPRAEAGAPALLSSAHALSRVWYRVSSAAMPTVSQRTEDRLGGLERALSGGTHGKPNLEG